MLLTCLLLPSCLPCLLMVFLLELVGSMLVNSQRLSKPHCLRTPRPSCGKGARRQLYIKVLGWLPSGIITRRWSQCLLCWATSVVPQLAWVTATAPYSLSCPAPSRPMLVWELTMEWTCLIPLHCFDLCFFFIDPVLSNDNGSCILSMFLLFRWMTLCGEEESTTVFAGRLDILSEYRMT